MTIRDRAFSLYTAPFKYINGHIFDANDKIIADEDNQDSIITRVRGCGEIQHKKNPEQLQDEIGHALTVYFDSLYEEELGVACFDPYDCREIDAIIEVVENAMINTL